MTDTFHGWHFSDDRERLRYGDGRKIKLGVTHTVNCEPVLCESGLHASEHVLDALTYAPGLILWEVTLSGKIVRGDDKACATERTYHAKIDASNVLNEFARKCALDVIHLWDAPDIVRKYLETGNNEFKAAARGATWDAARAAASADAWDAARGAARDAARAAASADAWDAASADAWDAARGAARDAARAAASADAWDAARGAARDAARAAARDAAWIAAWDAARAAASAAARDAASADAWDAARAVTIAAQKKTLDEMVAAHEGIFGES